METKHLDRSECLERKTLPKKSEIAKYWRNKIFDLDLFIDWGEPECWACGAFDSKYDCTNPNASVDEIFSVWDKQYYLERCHIVPKALGGCNCYGNIVLLCKECHKDNPDTNNPVLFLKWMRGRKSFVQINYEKIKNSFAEFNLELNDLNVFTLSSNRFFREYMKSKAVAVRGRYTLSTKVSCLIEWLDTYEEKELIGQLPGYLQKLIKGN